jgi:hypothetical protein
MNEMPQVPVVALDRALPDPFSSVGTEPRFTRRRHPDLDLMIG